MNQLQLSISIIGSGNLAWHLARQLYKCGYSIKAIFSRDIHNANLLANQVATKAVDNLHEIPLSDMYIFSIKDDAYTSVLSSLPATNAICIHTSGSLSMDIFSEISPNHGVLYPFQTFSKAKELNFNEIPLCVEASNEHTEQILLQLAKSLSTVNYRITSQQRASLHLAGVFACNFPNALYAIVEQILKEQQLDFSIVFPVIKETVEKLQYLSPIDAQTGPAVRHDEQIMEKHLGMLSDADYKDIYQLLSKIIQKQNTIK